MTISAYPLEWPVGWPRKTPGQRKGALFIDRQKRYISVAEGVRRVHEELKRLGVPESAIVISTNIRPQLGGRNSESVGKIPEPGVAVYWLTKGGERRCMAIDRYDGVAGNLGAVAASLEAMRAIERHGGAEILDRAFTGFTALPAPEQPFQVLGVGANASREEVERAYRLLASEHHPDRGGDADRMARINAARDQLLEGRP